MPVDDSARRGDDDSTQQVDGENLRELLTLWRDMDDAARRAIVGIARSVVRREQTHD